jgi:hypothetical protein
MVVPKDRLYSILKKKLLYHVTKSTTVTFTSTKLVNWRAILTGVAYYNHTCISNTENVYIFR